LTDAVRGGSIALLAATVTAQPFVAGAIWAAGFLPWIVFGPLAGLYLDRASRVRVLRVAAGVRALVAAAVATVLATGRLSAEILAVTAVCIAVLQVYSNTAQNSLMPDLVSEDELGSANARVSSAQSTASVLGLPIGGALASAAAAAPFGLIAALSLVQSYWASRLPESRAPQDDADRGQTRWRDELLAGVRAVLGRSRLRLLVLTVFVMNCMSGVVMATIPIVSVRVLGMSGLELGLMYALQAVALVAGNLLAGRLSRRKVDQYRVMATALILQVPSFVLLGFASSPAFIVAGLCLMGACAGVWNVPSSTALMIESKGPHRSRILAAYKTISVCGPPVGALAGGALGSLWSPRIALLTTALIGVLVSVVFVFTLVRARMSAGERI
jgi:predicted MFS family arabinose efflux permease